MYTVIYLNEYGEEMKRETFECRSSKTLSLLENLCADRGIVTVSVDPYNLIALIRPENA